MRGRSRSGVQLELPGASGLAPVRLLRDAAVRPAATALRGGDLERALRFLQASARLDPRRRKVA